MAKKREQTKEEAQDLYVKSVEVTLTEKAVAKGAPYAGLHEKGEKLLQTPRVAEHGKKVGYFK